MPKATKKERDELRRINLFMSGDLLISKNLMAFGKHRGKKLSNIPLKYLLWLSEIATGVLYKKVKEEIFRRHDVEFGTELIKKIKRR